MSLTNILVIIAIVLGYALTTVLAIETIMKSYKNSKKLILDTSGYILTIQNSTLLKMVLSLSDKRIKDNLRMICIVPLLNIFIIILLQTRTGNVYFIKYLTKYLGIRGRIAGVLVVETLLSLKAERGKYDYYEQKLRK